MSSSALPVRSTRRRSTRLVETGHARRLRGMTVIEVIVAVAVVTLLGGLVFRIVQTVSVDARRIEMADTVFGETRIAYQRLATAFEHSALGFSSEPTSGVVWSADRCVLPTTDYELSLGGGIVLRDLSSTGVLSANPDIEQSLRFEYAVEMNGLEPVWLDAAPAGSRPRLVRAKHVVEAGQGDEATSAALVSVFAP